MVQTVPHRFLRDRLAALGFRRRPESKGGEGLLPRDTRASQPGPRVVYFIGCGTNFQVPRTGEAAFRLLARAGCEVAVFPNVCCGLPPYSYGDLDAARELTRKNLDLLAAVDGDFLVTECGSCGRFLKQWADLFPADPIYQRRAEAWTSRLRDFTELLAELPLPAPPQPYPGRVTYHDPCHLGRGQKIREAPRRLLVEAAGAELVELPEADWCCGGAGSYNLTHPETSSQILDRKLANIAHTGADTLVTACPACMLQIAHGLRRQGSAVTVKHVAEVVAEAQGLLLAAD